MTDDCERKLFERARAGEHAAFDRLRALLEPIVRRFVRRLIGPTDGEEDVLQDAFLALYLNLERISSVEGLRPFLFRVVRNRCFSELRRQGRFAVISLDTGGPAGEPALEELPEHSPSPHDQVQWLLLFGEVQKAMEGLPELQRQTLILYVEEELTYQQIADAMATDIGTVKSRIYYARQNLRRHLPREIAEALGIHQENRHGNT